MVASGGDGRERDLREPVDVAARESSPRGREGELVVELRGLQRSFSGVPAIRDLSLTLVRGEFLSLLGPSGCGKTTTLRMIAGFERPDAGELLIMGRDVRGDPPNKRPVNTVFQSYALFSHLDVQANVEFGLREKGVGKVERAAAARDALALVRLHGYERRRPAQLSGGEQQRVALARAIVNRPEVLLLDEPLGALDLKLRRAMQEELKALQRRLGITFLYVTHDQEEALMMSDRVGVMSKGVLEQVGSPQELYDYPASAYVADFVGEANLLAGVLLEPSRDGRATVRLDSGAIVRSACSGLDLAGTPGILVLRPEKIRLRALTEGVATTGIAGVIREVYFVGSYRRIIVEIAAETRIAVVSPNLRLVTMEPGTRVGLSFDDDQGWFLPGEEVDAERLRSNAAIDRVPTDHLETIGSEEG